MGQSATCLPSLRCSKDFLVPYICLAPPISVISGWFTEKEIAQSTQYPSCHLQTHNCMWNLWLSDTCLLFQPLTRTNFPKCGFCRLAPAIWNTLPSTVLENLQFSNLGLRLAFLACLILTCNVMTCPPTDSEVKTHDGYKNVNYYFV